MREIPPDELIDRASELEEFLAMLAFEDEARLLTICDGPGTGKSDLLRKLEFNCGPRAAAVPAARVKLDEKTVTDEYSLVQRIREQLDKCPFPNFDYYDDRRMNHDWEPFAAPAPVPALAGVAGVIDLRDADVHGGEFAVVRTTGPVTLNQAAPRRSYPQWSSGDQEQKARKRCVSAFLEDLRALSAEQAVVLLLDTFEEHANTLLGDWIMNEIVWPLCIEESRPRRFVLVVAGQCPLKLDGRLPEDRGQLVRSRNALTWEDDHVREFLALHGFGHLDEWHVDTVCTLVRRGASISKALKVAEALAA